MADSAIRATRTLPDCRSFTLIEMLVSLAIFSIIMVLVAQMISETELAWKRSSANIQAFQGARTAFDTMYRTISESTLNTYYDYYEYSNSEYVPYSTNNATNFAPAAYGRYSELHFICGPSLVTLPRAQVTHSIFFQTPASYTATSSSYGNMNSLLNAVGFYIDFNTDYSSWPAFLTTLSIPPAQRWRYRLMEFIQPTEQLTIYTNTTGTGWFTNAIASSSPPVEVLAENIIACVICPHLSGELTPNEPYSTLATNYEYDSRMGATASTSGWTNGAQPTAMNQLPPLVRVVLIAADEPSMIQFQGSSTTQPNLGFSYTNVFQTANNLTTDIATVSAALTADHVNFHVFQTDIPIRSAEWSESTTSAN
ncbi:MAG: Verru_Chthon cassette protein C [Methylacidiphilales bacterium]|nr:Verru_Chthon cassette protein C [Candidatus Methylacidiphilales bacterium]